MTPAVSSTVADARPLLFGGVPWYDTLHEENPDTWAAWRITKSPETAWWKDLLSAAALFAADHQLLNGYKKRFAGIPVAALTVARADRDGRSPTDPIWDIANELIVARYLERVLQWRYVAHEPQGRGTRRGDWQFTSSSGRSVFVEVKSLQESERIPTGVYSRPLYSRRIRAVLKEAYSQLPDNGQTTLVVLVGRGQLIRIPFGIMHGDIFQSLFGQMQITFRVMPYDPDSLQLRPSFRDRFLHGSKHRRLGLVAGMVLTGMDIPNISFYVVHNPYAHASCRMAAADVEPADQFVIDDNGYGDIRKGLIPAGIWRRMSGDGTLDTEALGQK